MSCGMSGGFTWAGYDEAAQWCLDNNYNLEEALKWEETSIQNEERFENWETKSRILEAMGRKEDGAKALSTAINKTAARFSCTRMRAACNGRGIPSGHLSCILKSRRRMRIIGSATWRSRRVSSNAGDFPACR